MDLYLIRHGESFVNLGDWENLKTMDTALTDKGKRQAEALAAWMQKHDIKGNALYASTMVRTRETASYIEPVLGLTPIYDDRLREIGSNYTDSTAIPEPDLPGKFVENFFFNPAYTPIAHGSDRMESWMHTRIRVGRFMEEIAQKHMNENVFVVAHGGIIGTVFDNVFHVGFARVCSIYVDNTAITHFRFRENGQVSLMYHNRVNHLVEAGLV